MENMGQGEKDGRLQITDMMLEAIGWRKA